MKSPLEMRRIEMVLYLTTWQTLQSSNAFSILLTLAAILSLRNVPEGSYETVVWGTTGRPVEGLVGVVGG